MQSIFHTFKKSVYDPLFYKNIHEVSLKEGLHFYFKFALFLAAVMLAVFTLVLVPRGVSFVRDVAPTLVMGYFPKDLTVTVTKGEVSVNVPEPYIVSKDTPILGITGLKKGLENVLVINTKEAFDKQKFVDYKTFALLTKTELVTQSISGSITIQEIPSAMNLVVNQQILLDLVEKIRSSLVYAVPLGLAGTFLLLFLGLMFYLIPLFLFALIPMCLAWVKKGTTISYKEAYIMSLHAIMPGLALKSILNMMGIFVVPSSLNVLLFLLIIAINFREVEHVHKD